MEVRIADGVVRVGPTECTSAVSSDVEGRMYEHAKALGITLITISLRCVSFLLPLSGPLLCRTSDSLASAGPP